MNKDLTVKDIIGTMSDAQKNTLCLYMRSAYGLGKIKCKPPYAAIDSLNENQKKVFYYLIGTALDKSCTPDVLEIIKEVSNGNKN